MAAKMKELGEVEKHTYYINVASSEILNDRKTDEWEYEIQATEGEIAELRERLETARASSTHNFLSTMATPFSSNHEEVNEQYDDSLSSVYQMIYDLGDDRVKDQIESMGILDGSR